MAKRKRKRSLPHFRRLEWCKVPVAKATKIDGITTYYIQDEWKRLPYVKPKKNPAPKPPPPLPFISSRKEVGNIVEERMLFNSKLRVRMAQIAAIQKRLLNYA